MLEAQDILKRDGNNLEARRLLGRIYLRSLGDMQAGTQSQEILKLAIDQYEQIVKLDPKSVEDHLLLGRLYRLNNELLKSENEFKAAVKIQPDSEEAVTTLAYLYNEEGDSESRTAGAEHDSGEGSHCQAVFGVWATPTSSRRTTSRRSTPIASRPSWTTTTSMPCAGWPRT